jgi:hypothetical protein
MVGNAEESHCPWAEAGPYMDSTYEELFVEGDYDIEQEAYHTQYACKISCVMV